MLPKRNSESPTLYAVLIEKSFDVQKTNVRIPLSR